MAERVPHPSNYIPLPGPNDSQPEPHSTPLIPPPPPLPLPPSYTLQTQSASATYVVQVPKDQIYRVPPPENAAIAERRNNPIVSGGGKKIRPCCSSCCCCVFLFIVILIIALALGLSIFALYFQPKDPNFSIIRLEIIDVLNSSLTRNDFQSRKDFKIKLRSENSNAKVDILYEVGRAASLSVGQMNKRPETIAVGKFPAFYLMHGKTKSFDVVFHGSDNNVDRLRNKAQLKSKSKNEVKLYIEMKMTARTEVGTWKTGSMKLRIACNVTLDSLTKGTRVMTSKQCRTLREA